jgi:hypothetical protein
MDIYSHIPYTYLIGWSTLNKWYYGVEYSKSSKISNPKNLWITYFTSSKSVQAFRKLYGEPDIIKIRKTFNTPESAIDWESKVLRRILPKHPNKWINMAVPGSGFHTQNKILITNGIEQFMIPNDIPIPDGWYKGRSKKYQENVKISSKKRPWHFPALAHIKSVEKRKTSRLITNNIDTKLWSKDLPLPDDYKEGFSDEVRKKRSGQRKGKKHTKERKNNIAKSRVGYKYINNGITELQIKDKCLPDGFSWGRLPRTETHNINAGKTKKGLKWYTNGVHDIQRHENNVPLGYKPGRCLKIKRSKESNEKMVLTILGKKWYTNGSTNIRAFECPNGFRPGVTHKVKSNTA